MLCWATGVPCHLIDVAEAPRYLTHIAGVPHHLIDIADVGEAYSAGAFADAATAAVADVLARGRVPIVVGGTGFYLRTLMCAAPQAWSRRTCARPLSYQLLTSVCA